MTVGGFRDSSGGCTGFPGGSSPQLSTIPVDILAEKSGSRRIFPCVRPVSAVCRIFQRILKTLFSPGIFFVSPAHG
jgi:hypothetical protein